MQYERMKAFKIFQLMAVMMIMSLAIVSCSKEQNPETLNDIAYDVNAEYGYTVYIEEEAGYQPYLVLTNNYEDTKNVLLLREHVLDELQPYNDQQYGTSYYENSYIDQYLNKVYIELLSKSIQDNIIGTNILILDGATYSAIKDGAEAKSINRKAFLLSFAEISEIAKNREVFDGEILKYFNENREKLVAESSGGKPVVWMLRSPSLVYPTTSIAVATDGGIGLGGVVEGLRGVRPAFCLDRNTKIIEDSTIGKGEEVYILRL